MMLLVGDCVMMTVMMMMGGEGKITVDPPSLGLKSRVEHNWEENAVWA